MIKKDKIGDGGDGGTGDFFIFLALIRLTKADYFIIDAKKFFNFFFLSNFKIFIFFYLYIYIYIFYIFF